MKTLVLMVEYGAPPVFNANVADMEHVELVDLEISPLLSSRISEWDAVFQRSFVEEHPQVSGFKTKKERQRHNELGAFLANLLQQELEGKAVIAFRPL